MTHSDIHTDAGHVAGQQHANGYHATITPDELKIWMETPEAVAAAREAVGRKFAEEHPDTPVKTGSYGQLERILPETRWLWHPYIPASYLTMVAADSGVGKSAFVLHLIRHVLTGTPFPDGTDCPRSNHVLLCDTEVFQIEHIKRMKAWGIDRERVLTPFEDPSADFFLDQPDHLARLAKVANYYKPGIILLDSLSGGHTQDEISVETGRAIRNLATTIRQLNYQPAVVVTHHLNGGSPLEVASPPVTMRRIRGHTSTRQYFRVILGMHTPDPDQPDIKRVHFVKSNLSEFGKPLGIRWVDGEKLVWCDPPEPKEHANGGESKKERPGEIAKRFLLDMLADGPVASEIIIQDAEDKGISRTTLYTQRDRLGITTREKDGFWILP